MISALIRLLVAIAVLPDYQRWPDNYVHISFDNDPTADNPRLAKLDAAQRRELAGVPYALALNPCRMGLQHFMRENRRVGIPSQ